MLKHEDNIKAITEICTIAGTYPNTSQEDFKMQLAVLLEEGKEIVMAYLDDNYHSDDGMVDALPDTLFVLYTLMIERGLSPCQEVALDRPYVDETEKELYVMSLVRRTFRTLKKIASDGEFYLPAYMCQRLLSLLAALSALVGHDLQACLDVVIEANRRKFDTCLEDARLTVAKYADLGISTYIRETTCGDTRYFVVCVDGRQEKVDKVWPDHKWLKSHKWEGPVYHDNCFLAVGE